MTNITLMRLTVNALWAEIKRQRWRGPTSTRDLDNTSGNTPYQAIASGTPPNAPKRHTKIRQTQPQLLIGRIHPDHRHPHAAWVILERHHYTNALESASEHTREELAHAIHHASNEIYAWHHDGRGNTHLIRAWDPWITNPVMRFLQHLAPHAQLRHDDGLSSRYETATSTTTSRTLENVLP